MHLAPFSWYIHADRFRTYNVIVCTVILLINAPRAMQSIDREPLFCTQFAKQKVCPIVSAVQVFENTVGKGEIARNEQFLLFPQCFLTILRTFCQFPQI